MFTLLQRRKGWRKNYQPVDLCDFEEDKHFSRLSSSFPPPTFMVAIEAEL